MPASDLAARVAANGSVAVAASVSPSPKKKAHHPHHHARPHRSPPSTLLRTRPGAAVSFVSRTHIAVGVLGVALWLGMAAALAWDGAGSEARRARWGAVLAAPPGCVLRWRLAPLNYRLRGRLRALPAGTLAANALGCLCTALLSVVAVRALPPVGAGGPAASWGRVASARPRPGFAGRCRRSPP